MDNIKVSVIVAVYNVAEFLPLCIDTLLAQTMPESERELIFVDDCSTDGSYELLHEKLLSRSQNEHNAPPPEHTFTTQYTHITNPAQQR